VSLRYGVLSLVALFVIFLLILKNYETWTRPIETAPERSTAKKQEAKIENPPALRSQKVAGPSQSYVAIAEKNIFSPERKDFPVQSSDTRKLVRPQVILYGVTISDGYQFASIVNPGRSLLRGERETLSLKVGDKVGDYKLAKISSDRITLEAEGDAFEVLLYDPKMPKKRMDVRTEAKPATVTSTQPAPAGPIPKTTVPAPPSTVAEAAKPSPPPQAVAPQSPAIRGPVTSSPDVRRGRRIFYPPTGTFLPPGSQPPGTGENQ
jgi:cell division septation protein DedD